eukprot:12405620-Karenia_brevis.AAC.1
MVRTLVTPKKAEAQLPLACLPLQADHGWEDIVDLSAPAELREQMLHNDFVKWMSRVENQISDIAGFEGKDRDDFCTRAHGPKFVMKCALGNPGSAGRR